MELFFQPGESLFLEFQLLNGSGWLTSHRLILCKHPPRQLAGHTPENYWLKNFQEAQIKDTILTAKFYGKQAQIQLQLYAPSLLEDIKNYLEEAAKNWKKPDFLAGVKQFDPKEP